MTIHLVTRRPGKHGGKFARSFELIAVARPAWVFALSIVQWDIASGRSLNSAMAQSNVLSPDRAMRIPADGIFVST
ncbi:hypothetical protein ACQP2T_43300 [Nonomuraea sp. CA-143628]|uniref:hypothetical protein n=1 Tax=Nonomuraea sp. CA-143628 TaxID=3239997 RepID=UPI003D9290AA